MSRRNNPPANPLSGVLAIDKPIGISSMTAVAVVRRRGGGVRTGHAGTLDPLATGVLVLGLGRATRILQQLMVTDKAYRTRIDLSAFTSTDDLEGEREECPVAEPPTAAAVEAAVARFVGETLQRPPAYSAVKVDGRRAYDLARWRGRPAEIPPRPVHVHHIELIDYAWPEAEVEIRTAKGFYVRSLARDLGEMLGTGGHCLSIRRLAVGPFTAEMAVPLDDVPEPLTQDRLLTVEQALAFVGAA